MTRLRRYEENVELIFKILYFLLAAGTFCPFIYDSSLQPILVKMVLGVGGILLFLRAADWKHYIRMPGLSWMALFVLSFLLSSFMNRRYGMSENFKWMIWMILQMGCLYTCKLDRSRESYEKEFRILSHVMLGYSMIAAICSFWRFLRLGVLHPDKQNQLWQARRPLHFSWKDFQEKEIVQQLEHHRRRKYQ